jgi:hypothetical protein
VPAAIIATVAPFIVHAAGDVEAKLTGSPELALAVTVNGLVPKPTLLNAPNVIVCDPWLMVKLWVTGVAGWELLPRLAVTLAL